MCCTSEVMFERNKTGKSKLMTPSVCRCDGQATENKSQDPSTENSVDPEVYLESHQTPKTEQFAKIASS